MLILMRNILAKHFLAHRPNTRAKVAPRPKVLTPVETTKRWKFLKQKACRFTLHRLNQIRWRNIRRCQHQKMDMIPAHMPFDDHAITLHTGAPDQIAIRYTNITRQTSTAGREPKTPRRGIIDAILYRLQTGGPMTIPAPRLPQLRYCL